MLAKVTSAGVMGVDGFLVTVECDTGPGLNWFEAVGLAETAVHENGTLLGSIPHSRRLTSVTVQGSIKS